MGSKKYSYICLIKFLVILFVCLSSSPGIRASGAFPAAAPKGDMDSDLVSDILAAYTLPFQILEKTEKAVNRSTRPVFGVNFARPIVPNPTGTYLVVFGYAAYSDTPKDKLNIIYSDVSFSSQTTIGQAIVGQATYQIDDNLRVDTAYYMVTKLVSTSENLDLVVYQTTVGGSAFLDLTGTITIDRQEYRVSLSRHVLRPVSTGQEASRAAQETTVRGLILSGDLTLQIDEKIEAFAEGRVEGSNRAIHNRWTRGKDEYQFVDAWVKTRLRNGKVNGFGEAWSASGILNKNGQAYGELKLGSQATQRELMIVLPGEKIVLQAWEFEHP